MKKLNAAKKQPADALCMTARADTGTVAAWLAAGPKIGNIAYRGR